MMRPRSRIRVCGWRLIFVLSSTCDHCPGTLGIGGGPPRSAAAAPAPDARRERAARVATSLRIRPLFPTRVFPWLPTCKACVKRRPPALSPAARCQALAPVVGGSVGTSARPHPSMCLRPSARAWNPLCTPGRTRPGTYSTSVPLPEFLSSSEESSRWDLPCDSEGGQWAERTIMSRCRCRTV